MINRAELIELSLVDQPACPAALVDYRGPLPPHDRHCDNLIAAVKNWQARVELLRQIVRDAPDPPPAPLPPLPRAKSKPRLQTVPYRATAFGSLVWAIERNHAQ